MIEILSPTEVRRARETGALVATILHTLRDRVTAGTNLLEIDRWAHRMIEDAGAQSCYVDYEPSFGRGPFGHYICTSVNDAVLHGLPHDRVLTEGDLLSLDLAVSLGGVVADSAISFVVGERPTAQDSALIGATERALAAAIAVAGPGARVGDLSHAIGEVLTAAGLFEENRRRQQVDWTWTMVHDQLLRRLETNPRVGKIRGEVEQGVRDGSLTAALAAQRLLAAFDGTEPLDGTESLDGTE